jgi:hypothetical protein
MDHLRLAFDADTDAVKPKPMQNRGEARPPQRKRLLMLGAFVGTCFGVLAGVRALDAWHHGGHVPTGVLIWFGGMFVLGGALLLVPGIWRRETNSSIWAGKAVFGDLRPRNELPRWRRALWDLQQWLVARDQRRREAMQRDPELFRLRLALVPIAAGVTVLIYAVLR